MTNLPHLQRLPEGRSHLIVDGEPFLMRAGELHNSSLSSASYMSLVWPNLLSMGLNTVLGSVSWEQIEPAEGSFDWTELDKVVQAAETHGIKLVLLWFGSFKNGMSTYTPNWVKTDSKRFPRAEIADHNDGSLRTQNVLSLFHAEAVAADARAFTALMDHLRQTDKKQTVIMMQVENECGLLGDSRDRSDAATLAFEATVPSDLIDWLEEKPSNLSPAFEAAISSYRGKTSGSWSETFGRDPKADELFMAYHYAKYLETVAAAGKGVYPIPLFTNAWLANDEGDTEEVKAGGGNMPGVYPSGGPIPAVLDLWQFLAPSLDFISPDIYLMDYDMTCTSYSLGLQPLFIPEQRRDDNGALRIWSAIGTHNAIGVSPFGIDSLKSDECTFTSHYALLASITPHLLAARSEGRQICGFYFDESSSGFVKGSPKREFTFGNWKLDVSSALVFGKIKPAYGMVIELEDETFLLVGEGYQVSFESNKAGVVWNGLSVFREQEIEGPNGELKDGRWLNGDETVSRNGHTAARMPSHDPDYGDAFIAILIPARTRIAKAKPYALFK